VKRKPTPRRCFTPHLSRTPSKNSGEEEGNARSAFPLYVLLGRTPLFSTTPSPTFPRVARKWHGKSPVTGAARAGGAPVITPRGWKPRPPERNNDGRGRSFQGPPLAERRWGGGGLGRVFQMRCPGAVRLTVALCFRYPPVCARCFLKKGCVGKRPAAARLKATVRACVCVVVGVFRRVSGRGGRGGPGVRPRSQRPAPRPPPPPRPPEAAGLVSTLALGARPALRQEGWLLPFKKARAPRVPGNTRCHRNPAYNRSPPAARTHMHPSSHFARAPVEF
jgi:hypothetical protein